ncbi:hypothetical protein GW17_00013160 [Ensete ventricosum]|uniref:Uncharacterized protein n=1 Tax=Ensete ventricosum TaxID=4639 RepID=A0A444FJ33_ENSVE|nr:hypothetical protein B296_00049910 [Ensete ventricosum]RWW22629.1 hypothetical protein GW17_00013160 [Ensete ventricosum]RZS15869.1 hypothetical protein BHM03_00047773 [Ensete ventricosum]
MMNVKGRIDRREEERRIVGSIMVTTFVDCGWRRGEKTQQQKVLAAKRREEREGETTEKRMGMIGSWLPTKEREENKKERGKREEKDRKGTERGKREQ